ncbi:MAG: DUF2490 domain-containing protein [Bacteroidaceae bacterium]|nr:DUF2490 domain-containing protein [Bacteroidaceae bacterium]
MKIRYLVMSVALLFVGIGHCKAQSLWTSADIKAKVTTGVKAFAEAEYRTHNEFSSTERWSGSVGLEYEPWKFLELTLGYSYIHQQNEDRLTKGGNIELSHWQPKHRGFFAVTGKAEWKRFSFSLRERYQYTYRTSKVVEKYDMYDGDGVLRPVPKLEEEWNAGEGKQVLRSRLEVEYDIKKSPFSPYVSCEMYNLIEENFGIEKTRWTVGTSYKINKKHSVDLYYRYIDQSDDDEEGGHVIGVGYSFKL